jgi:hypothetical protein
MGEGWNFGLGHLLTTIFGIAVLWLAAAAYFANAIRSPEGRADQLRDYKERLDLKRWRRFRSALKRLLDGIDRFFGYRRPGGPTSLFFRPWARCLSLALVYPVAFFLIAYVAARKGDMAGVPLLDGKAGLEWRLGLLVWLAIVYGFFFVAYRRDWFEKFTNRLGNRLFGKRGPSRSGRVIREVIYYLAVVFAGVGAVAIAVTFAGAVAGAGAVAIAVIGAGVFAVAVAGVGGTIIFLFSFGDFGSLPSLAWVAFFFFFPFANSLLDWASLSATRWLMGRWVGEKEVEETNFGRYFWGLFMDLAAAAACVCLLAALLSAGMVGLNWALDAGGADQALRVDWMGLMGDFRADPLGDGLMVTLMLCSTLAPTLFHMAAGTAAAFPLPHPGRAYVYRVLESDAKPAAGKALGIGFLMAVQLLVPFVVWTIVLAMIARFFVPMSWMHRLMPDWFPENDGSLLLWLPYRAAEWTWVALTS